MCCRNVSFVLLILTLSNCFSNACVSDTYEDTFNLETNLNEISISHNFPSSSLNIVLDNNANAISLNIDASLKNLMLVDSFLTNSSWNINATAMPVGYVLPTDAPTDAPTEVGVGSTYQSGSGSSANAAETTMVCCVFLSSFVSSRLIFILHPSFMFNSFKYFSKLILHV